MKAVVAILFSLIFGTLLFGQSGVNLDFGARAGVPITKPLDESETELFNGVPFTFTESTARTFIVGPALGVTFFDRLRVEFDALHRPLRSTARINGTLWDFPIMANYRFLNGAVRPYAGAGLVLLRSVSATQLGNDALPGPAAIRFSDDQGFPAYIAQAGLEWKYAHFVIRPEARYSYWRQLGTSFGSIIQRNQVEFLVGFAFEPNKNK